MCVRVCVSEKERARESCSFRNRATEKACVRGCVRVCVRVCVSEKERARESCSFRNRAANCRARLQKETYGVATISRLLKIIRLFGEYRSLL